MIKKKTTYSNKTAKKLAKSEANPSRLKSYTRDPATPQTIQLLKIGLILLGALILGIFLWVQISNGIALNNDRGQFTKLQENVMNEGNLLKRVAPDLSEWVQKSSCYHTYSNVLFGGDGWTCNSEWTGNLSLGNVSEAYAMVSQFESSPLYSISIKADLSKLLDSDSIANPSLGFSNHGYDRGTGASCGLGFRTLNDKNIYISINFNCTDYAKASWYPNTEQDPTLPGLNAYKQ